MLVRYRQDIRSPDIIKQTPGKVPLPYQTQSSLSKRPRLSVDWPSSWLFPRSISVGLSKVLEEFKIKIFKMLLIGHIIVGSGSA